MRQTNRVIRIIRTTDTINEPFLRKVHQQLKEKNATRAMIISAGDFSSQSLEFANTRPIEILGKNELIGLLKKT
ncbi:restriction endonuclease [Spirochaetota bacterium]